MRLLMLCLAVVLLQLFSFPLYAEPTWIKDSAKGCQIWNPNPNPAPKLTVTWSGNCVGGSAEGVGELNWYTDGILLATEKLTDENGITMAAGHYSAWVSSSDVRVEIAESNWGEGFKEKSCESEYRAANAFVKKELALWSDGVATWVLNIAADSALKSCPGTGNTSISVYFEGDQPSSGFDAGRNKQLEGTRNNGQWSQENNYAKMKFDAIQNQEYRARLADLQLHERTAKEAREREQAENAHRIVRERYIAFVKKNGVTNYIELNALKANPFVYEGKVVAVQLVFSEMLSVDRGLFGHKDLGMAVVGDVVVSGIPRNLFTVNNTRVILAGKVIGKTPLKTPFGGEISVPHIQFAGVHICADDIYCSDLVQ